MIYRDLFLIAGDIYNNNYTMFCFMILSDNPLGYADLKVNAAKTSRRVLI